MLTSCYWGYYFLLVPLSIFRQPRVIDDDINGFQSNYWVVLLTKISIIDDSRLKNVHDLSWAHLNQQLSYLSAVCLRAAANSLPLQSLTMHTFSARDYKQEGINKLWNLKIVICVVFLCIWQYWSWKECPQYIWCTDEGTLFTYISPRKYLPKNSA